MREFSRRLASNGYDGCDDDATDSDCDDVDVSVADDPLHSDSGSESDSVSDSVSEHVSDEETKDDDTTDTICDVCGSNCLDSCAVDSCDRYIHIRCANFPRSPSELYCEAHKSLRRTDDNTATTCTQLSPKRKHRRQRRRPSRSNDNTATVRTQLLRPRRARRRSSRPINNTTSITNSTLSNQQIRPISHNDSNIIQNIRPFKKGLPNIGNTCYMGAVLQMMMSVPALAQSYAKCKSYFEPHTISHNVGTIFDDICNQNKSVSDETIQNFVVALDVYQRNRTDEYIESKRDDPEFDINEVARDFNWNSQSDADEFIRLFLFQSLEYELNNTQSIEFDRCSSWNILTDTLNNWTHPVSQYSQSSFLSDEQPDAELNLSPVLDVNTTKNDLMGCLLDTLDTDMEKTFHKIIANISTEVERTHCIKSLGKVLMININRYQFADNHVIKNKKKVVCNDALNLNYLVYDANGSTSRKNPHYKHVSRDGAYQYLLRGLLVHKGDYKRGESGAHYIALSKDRDNIWYEFDDRDVTPLYRRGTHEKYFSGTNCVVMALYVQKASENQYCFKPIGDSEIDHQQNPSSNVNRVVNNVSNDEDTNRGKKRGLRCVITDPMDDNHNKPSCRYALRSRDRKKRRVGQ